MANKPEPSARYISKRKGSYSPTTKRGAPQPSWLPLPAKEHGQRCGTMWWNRSGAQISCLLLRKERGKIAKHQEHSPATPLCVLGRGCSCFLPSNSSCPRLKAVRMDAAFTANFWLVWFYCSLHMVIQCIVSIPTPSLHRC